MNILTLDVKKRLLIILAMLSLFGLVFAQGTPRPQAGDYQASVGFITITSAAGWLVHNGTSWQTASVPLSQQTPFYGNIYSAQPIYIDADFTHMGNFYNTGSGSVEVIDNSTFTIGSTSNFRLNELYINPGTKVVNNGTISSSSTSATITMLSAANMNEAPVLENNKNIQLAGELNITNYGKVISGPLAKIDGVGRINTGNYGAEFTIANPGGYNTAFPISGAHNVRNASFIFNGTVDQVTGDKLPTPIHSLTVDNGNKLTLSKNITMTSEAVTGLTNPTPTVLVKDGNTLDVAHFIISSNSDEPNAVATFTLSAGATLATSHVIGISSVKDGTNRIQSGSIQTNIANYSSEANYHYYGPFIDQLSGIFYTTPDEKTVNDLTITNTSGVLIIPPEMEPLTINGTLTGQIRTLPVTLSYFGAYFNSGVDTVTLEWETQSETNNLGFYVLRAPVPELNIANLVSELIPSVNSSQGARYSHTDEALYDDGTYYYWLQDISLSGDVEIHGPTMVNVVLGSGGNGTPEIPRKTGFHRNFPNPFNPSTYLEYYLETNADVAFKVYNLKGQLVDEINLSNVSSGTHRYKWEPKLDSGIYLVKFIAAGQTNTRKVILSK